MNINISTTYEIGDVLFLEQSNGGGIRKLHIVDIIISVQKRTILYVFNKSVSIDRFKHIDYSYRRWNEVEVLQAIKYARRGNTWLTEKPVKKRKPLTPLTLKYWVCRNDSNS